MNGWQQILALLIVCITVSTMVSMACEAIKFYVKNRYEDNEDGER